MTLIEIMVVMAVLSVLAGILFPVFAQAREKARQVHCLSNQRQVSQALLLYAQDYEETLPFFGDQFPRTRSYWHSLIQPYLRNRRVITCPSWSPSGKYYNQRGTLVQGEHGLAVNYGIVFSYAWSDGEPNLEPTRLAEIRDPSTLMLLTEGQGNIHVYSPVRWKLNVDWDRDGVLDSHSGVLIGEGPYNRGDPFRHNGGSNCAFADGHIRWVDGKSWLTNKDDLWGSYLRQKR